MSQMLVTDEQLVQLLADFPVGTPAESLRAVADLVSGMDQEQALAYIDAFCIVAEAFCTAPEPMYSWWQACKRERPNSCGGDAARHLGMVVAIIGRRLYDDGVTR